MPVSYTSWLVALSIVLAIQGSYVGLSFAIQIAAATGARRRILLAGAAVCLALGIWTMHFVSMLAQRVPFPIDYLVLPTLLSFLVCVIVVGVAVLAVGAGAPTTLRIGAAATFMGLGIVTMHYVGMETLQACAQMHNSPPYVAASAAIAIAASATALWLAFSSATFSLPLSSIILGLAISGMHYTAVFGLTMIPRGGLTQSSALPPDLLAIVVAIVAFFVSGVFLVLLLPERTESAGAATSAVVALRAPKSVDAAAVLAPDDVALLDREEDVQCAGESTMSSAVPIERDGLKCYLPVESIVAVHADSHYSKIFDGTNTHFCALSIREVEQRLDPTRFVRVHRSHIVALPHVVGAKFTGDGGLLEVSTRDRYSIPVSRGRIAEIKSRLAASFAPARGIV